MADPTGLVPIYLRVAPVDIAMIKFVVESYEEVGVVRTIDRRLATIVVMVSRDFLDVARGILDDLHGRLTFEEIPPPPGADEDFMLRLIDD
ncbi:MAG: DUF4911 domain-containing protein [Candidatus Binatia bacterium]